MRSRTRAPSDVARLLSRAFRRKRAFNPRYSKAALARDLGVSAAFVTLLLAGKKHVPVSRLAALFHHLELDLPERAAVAKAILPAPLASRFTADSASPRKGRGSGRTIAESDGRSLIASWWNVAILEGLTLGSPHNEPARLRRRLGLTQKQWNEGVRCLREADLVEDHAGELRKRESHLYFPSGRSRKEFREFHGQWIAKAAEELTKCTTEEDFRRRLITGFTFALKPDLTNAMKEKILAFLDDLAGSASEGECADVYQCNIQFFPLTRPAAEASGERV